LKIIYNRKTVAYLLIPGRHLVITTFQEEYYQDILKKPISKWNIIGDWKSEDTHISEIIFAVTSSNQENSRYNPIPFYIRAITVDRFAEWLYKITNIRSRLVGILHYGVTENFASNVIKHITEKTEGEISINPSNTIVLCSTPEVVKLYRELGYAILPSEYDFDLNKYIAVTPNDVIKKIAELNDEWSPAQSKEMGLSRTTSSVWRDYREIPKIVRRIWKDPLLTEEGSLTGTRDYSTYAIGMNHQALMDVKYGDIKNFIVSGKIVDEGCADGALLVPISKDYPDSDLIGIEITGEFTARFQERQRAGDFGGSFSHVHQRNLMDEIFEPRSIDTTICNSTTHELWSYGEQRNTLVPYLERKYKQLRNGGRLIIRDVVGPPNKSKKIYMWLDDKDGLNEDIFKPCAGQAELKKHLDNLSTNARFRRFAEDFLSDMRKSGRRDNSTKIKYREENVSGVSYFVLTLKDSAEFLSKKDYTDNWKSELNEEFTHLDFEEWKKLLQKVGFKIIEDSINSEKSSRAYVNQWIVENRYKNKAKIFEMINKKLIQIDFPVTNMVLVGEKSE